MNLPLTPSALLAVILHGTTAGYAAVAAVLELSPEQRSTSLIPGALAFLGDQKGGDVVALPVGVVVGVLVGLAVRAALRAQHDERRRTRLTVHLLWWACPGAIALGALVLDRLLVPGLCMLTVGSGLLIAAETALSRRAGRMLSPAAASASALGCLLWFLCPAALLVAASRTTLGIAEVLGHAVELCVAAGLVAAVVELHGAWRGRSGLHARVRPFTALPACALPLMLLALYPARLRLPGGDVDAYDVQPLLLVVCWVIAVACVVASVVHFRRSARAGGVTVRALPSAVVLPVLLIASFGVTRPPIVTNDDYHFGETLIGWMRYRAGDLPYLDHQPAHGVVQDDVAAALSSLFFDGSAASHTESTRLMCAVLASLIFVVVRFASRSQLVASLAMLAGTAPILSIDVPMNGLTWAFVIAMAWLLAAPRLRDVPQWWLATWMIGIPLMALAAPAQGLVLMIAASALAVRSGGQLLASRDWRLLLPPAVVAALLAVAAVATPLGAMVVAAVSYVLRNAQVNVAAYGISWNPAMTGESGTGFVLDTLRMAWVVGLVLCSLVALGEIRARRWRSEVLARAVFFALFLGGMLPYVMGRVDAGAVSRPGLATAFVMAAVVPALLWRRLKPTGRAMTAVGVLASVSALFGPLAQPATVVAAAAPFVSTPDLVDGADIGLPGWGRAAPLDVASLEETARLASALAADLEPGAAYYDATSHNAQYFYVGRRPRVSVTATYNTPLLADQRRTIRQLRRARPQLAVFHQPSGNIDHDGGGVGLRTPLLARYLERAYTPFVRDGFVLGSWGRGAPEADPLVTLTLDDLSDDVWDRGVSRTSSSIRLDDPVAALLLKDGAEVALPDGSRRRVVTRTAGGVVELDRPVGDALAGVVARNVTVEVDDVDRRVYRAWLFERSFGQSDLLRLPASWGASLTSIDGISEVADVDGGGTMAGLLSSLRVDLPSEVDDADVDLVSFDAQCVGSEDLSARIGVSWETPRTFGDAPDRTFELVSGRQLVPLDSSAFWRAAFDAEALTFTVLDGGSCTSVEISDLVLWSRQG